jgi:hypothetical protein
VLSRSGSGGGLLCYSLLRCSLLGGSLLCCSLLGGGLLCGGECGLRRLRRLLGGGGGGLRGLGVLHHLLCRSCECGVVPGDVLHQRHGSVGVRERVLLHGRAVAVCTGRALWGGGCNRCGYWRVGRGYWRIGHGDWHVGRGGRVLLLFLCRRRREAPG